MTRFFPKAFLMAGTVAVAAAVSTVAVQADETLVVPMHAVSAEGIGADIGTIKISPKGAGISLDIDVTGIPAGPHGFHLHANGDCAAAEQDGKMVAALAAGGHYDPAAAKSHKGPEGQGHKGDLPLLTATDKGVKSVVSADHISMDDVKGRSLMIHAGGDNYSDEPANGGGGGRIACGVIPKG